MAAASNLSVGAGCADRYPKRISGVSSRKMPSGTILRRKETAVSSRFVIIQSMPIRASIAGASAGSAPGQGSGRVPMWAVIADDEPLARDELRFLLEETGEVEVVGAANGLEALDLIEKQRSRHDACNGRYQYRILKCRNDFSFI